MPRYDPSPRVYEYVPFDKDMLLEAIDRLTPLLAKYNGERIVKGENPIHTAVVSLERLCRVRVDGGNIQPQKMPHCIICNPWFSMVKDSRAGDSEEAMISCKDLAFYLKQFRDAVCDGRYEQALTGNETKRMMGELFRSFGRRSPEYESVGDSRLREEHLGAEPQ